MSSQPSLTSSVLRCEIRRLACHSVYSYDSPWNEEHKGPQLKIRSSLFSCTFQTRGHMSKNKYHVKSTLIFHSIMSVNYLLPQRPTMPA